MDVIVPDGRSGRWTVETFYITEAEVERNSRGLRPEHLKHIAPGKYKRLVCNGTVVMSNVPMEVRTNQPFVDAAYGSVLINGLGLGMVLKAILDKPEVGHVTVLECERDVIALVAPSFQDPRVEIVCADAFSWRPRDYYDAVWHDIWNAISAANLPEMDLLHRRYARFAGWQGSWGREECEAEAAKRVVARVVEGAEVGR